MKLKRAKSAATQQLAYARMQAWAGIVAAGATIVITTFAAIIAILQWQSSERQVALETAKARPRYAGSITLRANVGLAARGEALPETLSLDVNGGIFSTTSIWAFQYAEISDGRERHPNLEYTPCIVRVGGYWTNPITTPAVAMPHLNFAKAWTEGVFLPTGKRLVITSFATEVRHDYLDVFQKPARDVLFLMDGAEPRVWTGREADRRAIKGAVYVALTERRLRDSNTSGFELQVVSNALLRGPLSETLPQECRSILAY